MASLFSDHPKLKLTPAAFFKWATKSAFKFATDIQQSLLLLQCSKHPVWQLKLSLPFILRHFEGKGRNQPTTTPRYKKNAKIQNPKSKNANALMRAGENWENAMKTDLNSVVGGAVNGEEMNDERKRMKEKRPPGTCVLLHPNQTEDRRAYANPNSAANRVFLLPRLSLPFFAPGGHCHS